MKSLTLLVAATARATVAFAPTGYARRLIHRSLLATASYTSESVGTNPSLDYKMYITEDGARVSPWHDIPLKPEGAASNVFNLFTEIPKMTTAKMEIATGEAANPVMQDEKKGKLRYYHGPIFWNYGCIPQTWEDPNEEHPELKVFGDNDPVDVVEIGSEALASGSITPVKVLGTLAMIDDGELDWKVVAISTADPLAASLNDVADVEANCPGVISGIREWFRWYKTPDGKPINAFGFGEECLGSAAAVEVIGETHDAWKALKEGKSDSGKLWLE